MTLASELTKVQYNGDGSTTAFTVSFVFYENSGIKAILLSAAGVETTQTLDTDYTLSGGNGITGTLTMTTAPASGETLTIKSDIPDTQDTSLPLGGALASTAIELRLDILTRLIQQKEEDISRTLLLFESTTLSELTFPAPGAGKFIKWNAAGTAIITSAASIISIADDDNDTKIQVEESTDEDIIRFDVAGSEVATMSATAIALKLPVSITGALTVSSTVDGRDVATDGTKLDLTVSVVDFGATGDGTTDDITAIQLAIASLAATGGIVFFPIGVYLVSAAIELFKNYVSILGDGEYATEIKTSSLTDNVIEIGDGTSGLSNVWISKLAISSSVTKTAGAGILFQNHHNCGAERIRQDNALLFDGIRIEGGTNHFITKILNCELNGGSNSAIRLGSTTSVSNTYLDNLIIGSQTGSTGMLIENCNGLFASNIDIISRNIGIKVAPVSPNICRNMFFSQVLCDTSTSEGWQFISTGEISQVSLVNCWASTNGQGVGKAGILLSNSNMNGVTIESTMIVNNGGHGIEFLNGTNVSIIGGCQIYFNDVDQGDRHGIGIAAGVSDFTISDNRIGNGGQFSSNRQNYGIFINSGASDNYNITNNDLTGNVTGGLADNGTGTNKRVYGNLPFEDNNTWNLGNGASLTRHLSATATLNFPSTTAQSSNDLTITVTGAVVGDTVVLGIPDGSVTTGVYSAWVSVADTVKVRFNNYSSGTLDPTSGTFRVDVWQH